MKTQLLLFLLIAVCPHSIFSQINFQNPSFEGDIGLELIPDFWDNCENTPDTGGDDQVPYAAALAPSHGNSYIALVGWEGRHEAVGQLLDEVLLEGNQYEFEMDAAYIAVDAPDSQRIVQIVLSKTPCGYDQIIYPPEALDSIWKRQKIKFTPDDDYQYISFMTGLFIDDNITSLQIAIALDNLSEIKDITSSIKEGLVLEKPTIEHRSNFIYIDKNRGNSDLYIYNYSGQLINSYPIDSYEKAIDISNLGHGIIILELINKNDNFRVVERFLKG